MSDKAVSGFIWRMGHMIFLFLDREIIVVALVVMCITRRVMSRRLGMVKSETFPPITSFPRGDVVIVPVSYRSGAFLKMERIDNNIVDLSKEDVYSILEAIF